MSGALIPVDGGGSPARCSICGDEAAGPCARCHQPTCGDCCVLTEGGAKVWAICSRCERKGGRSLRSGWAIVLAWILVPTVGIALLLVLLALAFGKL